MTQYDYVRIRINESERALLQGMVDSDKASTLSDAVRQLAFDQGAATREIAAQYLQEISGAHRALSELVRATLDNKTLHEPEIIAMEREVAALARSAAKLSRTIRRRT